MLGEELLLASVLRKDSVLDSIHPAGWPAFPALLLNGLLLLLWRLEGICCQ